LGPVVVVEQRMVARMAAQRQAARVGPGATTWAAAAARAALGLTGRVVLGQLQRAGVVALPTVARAVQAALGLSGTALTEWAAVVEAVQISVARVERLVCMVAGPVLPVTRLRRFTVHKASVW
jgi:hypothetical protein